MHLTTLHAHLLSEIEGRTYRPLLQEITRTHAAFEPYATWGALAAAVTANRLPSTVEDAILSPLIATYARERSEPWSTILCAIAFRWLIASHGRRAEWIGGDPEEAWQELIATFLEVCCRVVARGATTRIRHLLISQMQHRFYETCAYRWRHEASEIATAPDSMRLTGDPHTSARRMEALVDLRDMQERGAAALRQHRATGTISATDAALITATRLAGETVAEAAAHLGLTAGTAKKRRQRAEAAMRATTVGGAS